MTPSFFEEDERPEQEAAESFETAEELWSSVGLYHLTQESLGEELKLHGLNEKLMRELVGAVNRVNYNQGKRRSRRLLLAH